jgi:hypothetical protein
LPPLLPLPTSPANLDLAASSSETVAAFSSDFLGEGAILG